MKKYNTSDPQEKPSVVMLLYGEGGVGKTTFVATAPKPLLADCENGAKYLGLRGIKLDVARIDRWADMQEYLKEVATDGYETIAIDPVGELMDKLKRYMLSLKDNKLVQKDGTPSMAGWGWLKKTLRDYLKLLRDTGRHVILVAHVEEKDDEGRIVKRPKVETKLSEELVNLVDIVAFMEVIKDENGEVKRLLRVDPESDKFIAKDRTGQLGKIVEPDFGKIVSASQGTETFSWSKSAAPKEEPKTASAEQEPGTDRLRDAYRKIHDRIMKATGFDDPSMYVEYSDEALLGELRAFAIEIDALPTDLNQARMLYTRVGRAIASAKPQ